MVYKITYLVAKVVFYSLKHSKFCKISHFLVFFHIQVYKNTIKF